ncbi:MAG: ferrous iron transport protein B [archaeon]|nr:ferrous iron transport protein B [archaeon]
MDKFIIGLAGNPNVGKTTVFNQLTGMHQHVGNWPGKTVERAEGHFDFDGFHFDIVDLPGNYALSAHSIEEIVSRDFIVDENSDVIINVVDAANLERNLYLTVQMMELGANLVLALNMNKFAIKKEHIIDLKLISELLGFPVVEIDAKDKIGFDNLLSTVKNAIDNPIDSTEKLVYGNELKEHLADIVKLIEKDPSLEKLPSYWVAVKLLENDEIIVKKVEDSIYSTQIQKEVVNVKKHLKDIFKQDSEEIIANARYAFIDGLMNEAVERPEVEKPSVTDKIDNILTNRILGLPIFLVIMYLIFQITFELGKPFQELFSVGVIYFGNFIASILGPHWYTSLLVDGVIAGVGGVLVFFPQIFIMFFMISVLEDTGYLARAAFVMDKVIHKFVGLHGKAFIPMILGFGCGVPGIMATRTLENEKDRILTMMIIPFMSCSSRLPVYALFIGAFFSAYQGPVLFSIYLLGIVVAIIVARILKKTIFRGISAPFVMELPTYKLPSFKGVLLHTWEKAFGFVKKAGTIILGASIVVWLLSSLPLGVKYGSQTSIIGQIGTFISPVFAPLGFGQWHASVAILFGVVAKEVVVGIYSSIFSSSVSLTGALQGLFTPLSAFSFMVFILLYVPCIPALTTIKQETNSWKWPMFMVCITTVTAYIVSFLVYNCGLLLGFA